MRQNNVTSDCREAWKADKIQTIGKIKRSFQQQQSFLEVKVCLPSGSKGPNKTMILVINQWRSPTDKRFPDCRNEPGFQTKSIKMQCKKDFFRIWEIYRNLPVLCLTQHFTGPQIKISESALARGTYAQFFHKSRNSTPLQRNPKYIKTRLFSVSPSTFNRTPNTKNLKVLWLGEPMPNLSQIWKQWSRFGNNKLLWSKPMKVKKKTHTQKNNTNKFFCFFFSNPGMFYFVNLLRCIMSGMSESVMVAYTHKYAKV